MSTSHNNPTTSRYLDGRVLTASQPELQLMLVDAAHRFLRQAASLWDAEGKSLERDRLLDRALTVAEQLVASVVGRGSEASRRLEEEYAFVYRQLALCKVMHDIEALNSAIPVLEIHRDTWRMACEKLKAQSVSGPNFELGHAPTCGFSSHA